MKATPDAQALLTETARMLRKELAAHQTGAARFKLLMAANAIDIARREFAATDQLEKSLSSLPTKLVQPIRAGLHDGDPALHEILTRITLENLRVSNPAAAQD